MLFLTACPKPATKEEVKVKVSTVEKDFVSLMETGFIPPVIRLGDSYVNDKIESKEKKLSYEYHYIVVTDDFDSIKDEELFAAGTTVHNATIDEADAGNASKTNLKYEKLKAVNGGEVCIGTRFVLGLIVKDQTNEEIYKARVNFSIFAPRAGAEAIEKNSISIPGDHTAFEGTVSTDGGDDVKAGAIKYDKGKTRYEFSKSLKDKLVALKFGNFGTTNKVLVK